MVAESAAAYEETWSQLQEPARPSHEPSVPLLRLLAALDTGWQVEEPVYLRPRWSDGGARVYCFILHRARPELPYLLTVPATATVEQFVRNEGLRVIR
jgi:hypothetical protein